MFNLHFFQIIVKQNLSMEREIYQFQQLFSSYHDWKANSLGNLFSAIFLQYLFLFIREYRLSTQSKVGSMLGNKEKKWKSSVPIYSRELSLWRVTGPQVSNYKQKVLWHLREDVSQESQRRSSCHGSVVNESDQEP